MRTSIWTADEKPEGVDDWRMEVGAQSFPADKDGCKAFVCVGLPVHSVDVTGDNQLRFRTQVPHGEVGRMDLYLTPEQAAELRDLLHKALPVEVEAEAAI